MAKRKSKQAVVPKSVSEPTSRPVLVGAPPGLVRRFAGMLYETLLVAGLLAVFFLMPHVAMGVILQRAVPPAILLLHCALVLMFYFCWFWLHGGQTLAMRTWKMKVVADTGLPLRPAQALLRYLAAWFSVGSVFGLLWALIDKDKQFLHDRIAGTRLVVTA